MEFNKSAWVAAWKAWDKVKGLIGFATREIAFVQGYYMALNQNKSVDSRDFAEAELHMRRNCPECTCSLINDYGHFFVINICTSCKFTEVIPYDESFKYINIRKFK